MKRIGYIYEKVYDIENLKLAHKNARKDKTFYKEVQMVDKDEDKYLGEIRQLLKESKYKVSPYSKLTINDKGKERVLHKLPYYPDRIIQWAIMLQIEDIFIKTFTTFTCASIPKYVIRYMDDVVILGSSKKSLHKLLLDISEYLDKELKLKVKDNYQIFPTRTRGIDFVGYRHFGDYKLLRKNTCKRFKKKMRDVKTREIDYSDFCSVNSYKGWLMWCNSFRLSLKYILPIQFKVDEYLKSN